MNWLKEKGCDFSGITFYAAVNGGNLKSMKWLKKNGCPMNINTTFNIAAGNGNLLEYFHNIGIKRHIIQWMQSNGCPLGKRSL